MIKKHIKIFSLILVACQVLTIFPIATGADFGNENVLPARVLAGLGIIETPPELDWSRLDMTRAQFVAAVMNMMFDKNKNALSKNTFKDVSSESAEANAISLALQTGVLEIGSGYLNPNGAADLDFVVETALNAMGYKPIAELKGGKTADYFLLPAANVITAGVKTNGKKLSLDACYKLLYNILSADIAAVKGAKDSGLEIETEKGVSLINFYRDIYRGRGQITATYLEGIAGNAAVGKGLVRIDDKVFRTDLDFSDMLGRHIEYYTEKKENDFETLLFCTIDEGRDETIEISAVDVEDFSNYTYTYISGNKKRSIGISTSRQVIYNGKTVDLAHYSDALMKPASGSVTLIKTAGSSAYNVVIIEAYADIEVINTDAEKRIIYTFAGGYKYLSDNPLECRLIGASGGEYDFKNIKKNHIVSIAESVDQSFVTAVVSEKTVSGKVRRITGDKKITVGTADYRVSPSSRNVFNSSGKFLISPGESATFRLNGFDEIVSFEKDDLTEQNVVFVTDIENSSGIDATLQIKAFGREDGVKILGFEKNVRVDGVSMQRQSVKSYLKPHLPTVIMYKTNSSGNIVEIDSPIGVPETEDSLVKRWSASDEMLEWRSMDSFGSFGVKFPINEETLVLDAAGSTGENKVFVQKSLVNDCRYGVDVYSFGADSPVADVVVIMSGGDNIFQNQISVLSEVYTTLNSEGLPAKVCSIYENGEYRNIFVENGFENITEKAGCGDVVRCSLNSNGNLVDFSVIYSRQNNAFAFANGESTSYHDDFRLIGGEVYLAKDGYVRVALNPGVHTDSSLETYKLPSSAFICEIQQSTEKPVFTRATADMLLDNKNFGSKADFIVMRTSYMRPQIAYIIR